MKVGFFASALITASAAQAAATDNLSGISTAEGLGQASASCAAALQSGNLDPVNLQNHGWQLVSNPKPSQRSTFFRGDDHTVRITTTSMFGQMCIVEGHSTSDDQTALIEAITKQVEAEIDEKVAEYDGVKAPKTGVMMRTFFTNKIQIVVSSWPDSSVMISMRPL